MIGLSEIKMVLWEEIMRLSPMIFRKSEDF